MEAGGVLHFPKLLKGASAPGTQADVPAGRMMMQAQSNVTLEALSFVQVVSVDALSQRALGNVFNEFESIRFSPMLSGSLCFLKLFDS